MVFFKILLFSFLIYYCLCVEEIQFSVRKVSLPKSPCAPTSGQYSFDIEGEFSAEVFLSDEIYIDMALPNNTKAKCNPYGKNSFTPSKLHCSLDICFNPLNSSKIMLPLTPPQLDKYKIQKWEEIIGAEDGKSNLVSENAECFPKETNTFIQTSLISKGCSGTKNIFSINGDWENQNKLPSINFNFKIRIDNDNKDIAECRLENKNLKQFECSFDGEGDIKFEEKYFQGFLNSYKLENTSSIHVDRCLKSSYLFLNLNVLILLVFFLF
jgi:hypothetical protein